LICKLCFSLHISSKGGRYNWLVLGYDTAKVDTYAC
jgi:hypothetical protein